MDARTRSHRRAALARASAAAAGFALVLVLAAPSAGIPDLPIGTTSTTGPDSGGSSSTSSSTSTTSSSTSTTVLPSVTTTTAPSESPAPGTEPETPATPPPSAPTGGDGAPSLDEALDAPPLTIPDWALEQINSVPRSGGNSTMRILERLRPLLSFGFTEAEAASIGLGQFPIKGSATFADDWWYPRFVPEFHLHEGTDVFADFGTPVTAPFDGVVTMGEGPVGGKYAYLTVEDGTYYYFAHLDTLPTLPEEQRIADPEEAGRYAFRSFDVPAAYRVEAGEVIGTVGDSGNAKGGAPHAHIEIHPQGGDPTNPKPILDQWLREAEEGLDDVIALYTSRGPKAVVTTQRTRASGPGQFAAPSRPLAPEMLGVSGAGPGTSVEVVASEVARAVARIDWTAYRAHVEGPMRSIEAVLAALVPSDGHAHGVAGAGSLAASPGAR